MWNGCVCVVVEWCVRVEWVCVAVCGCGSKKEWKYGCVDRVVHVE